MGLWMGVGVVGWELGVVRPNISESYMATVSLESQGMQGTGVMAANATSGMQFQGVRYAGSDMSTVNVTIRYDLSTQYTVWPNGTHEVCDQSLTLSESAPSLWQWLENADYLGTWNGNQVWSMVDFAMTNITLYAVAPLNDSTPASVPYQVVTQALGLSHSVRFLDWSPVPPVYAFFRTPPACTPRFNTNNP